AKNGIIGPDEITAEYLRGRTENEWEPVESDPDAHYEEKMDIDLAEIEPLVAAPHLPSNVHKVSDLEETLLDQVVIGSCTNGRMGDLRIAAGILKRQVADPGLRLIVIPGSQGVFQQALAEGLVETFVEAGAVISPPTCGPCLGGHMGVLAAGERCLATTNRNFRGRMGDTASEVFLSGPAVAAASAVLGRVGHPDELT
ncbi:MAG: aconitase family protein, partial [Terriglobia bacterium]